jgi:hypothetical protein
MKTLKHLSLFAESSPDVLQARSKETIINTAVVYIGGIL